MKKLTLIAIISILIVGTTTLSAGDEEWETAGKILVGTEVVRIVFGHDILGNIFGTKDDKEIPKYRSYPNSSPSRRSKGDVYVEGHYEIIKKEVWVDTSYWVTEEVPAHRKGNRYIEAHKVRRWIKDGHWEVVEEKVWVPDHWEYH